MTMMTGTVEQVSTKDVNTKFGLKPTYSLKVNGGWVKCGFKNPKANVGDTVQFDGEHGTYGLETKAVTVTSKGSSSGVALGGSSTPVVMTGALSTGKPFAGGSGYKDKVFPIPPLHGDRAIIRQNALARATDLVIAAKGAKPFEVDEASLNVIISFARKFESYTAGDLDLAEAIAEQASEKASTSSDSE